MYVAIKQARVNDKFQDPLYLFLELVRAGVMHGHLWSGRAFSGGPSFGTGMCPHDAMYVLSHTGFVRSTRWWKVMHAAGHASTQHCPVEFKGMFGPFISCQSVADHAMQSTTNRRKNGRHRYPGNYWCLTRLCDLWHGLFGPFWRLRRWICCSEMMPAVHGMIFWTSRSHSHSRQRSTRALVCLPRFIWTRSHTSITAHAYATLTLKGWRRLKQWHSKSVKRTSLELNILNRKSNEVSDFGMWWETLIVAVDAGHELTMSALGAHCDEALTFGRLGPSRTNRSVRSGWGLVGPNAALRRVRSHPDAVVNGIIDLLIWIPSRIMLLCW